MAYDGSTSWMWSLCLSTFSGLATGIGGVIAVWRRPDDQQLALLLGIAIGVMLCLSVVEMLVINAMRMGVVMVTTAFACGSGFYFGAVPFFPEISVDHPEETQDGKAGVLASAPPRQAKVLGEGFALLSTHDEEQAGGPAASADGHTMLSSVRGSMKALGGEPSDLNNSPLTGGGLFTRGAPSPHAVLHHSHQHQHQHQHHNHNHNHNHSNQHQHYHQQQPPLEHPGGSLHGAHAPAHSLALLERSHSLSSVTNGPLCGSSSTLLVSRDNTPHHAIPTHAIHSHAIPLHASPLQAASSGPSTASTSSGPTAKASNASTVAAFFSTSPRSAEPPPVLAQHAPSQPFLGMLNFNGPKAPVPASDWSMTSTHDPVVLTSHPLPPQYLHPTSTAPHGSSTPSTASSFSGHPHRHYRSDRSPHGGTEGSHGLLSYAPGLLQRGGSMGALALSRHHSLLPTEAFQGGFLGAEGGTVDRGRVNDGGDACAPILPDYLADLAPHLLRQNSMDGVPGGLRTDASSAGGGAVNGQGICREGSGGRLWEATPARIVHIFNASRTNHDDSGQGPMGTDSAEAFSASLPLSLPGPKSGPAHHLPPCLPSATLDAKGAPVTAGGDLSKPEPYFQGMAMTKLQRPRVVPGAQAPGSPTRTVETASQSGCGDGSGANRHGGFGGVDGGGRDGSGSPPLGDGGDARSTHHSVPNATRARDDRAALSHMGHAGAVPSDDMGGRRPGGGGWAWGVLSLPGRLFRRRGDGGASHTAGGGGGGGGATGEDWSGNKATWGSLPGSIRDGGVARKFGTDPNDKLPGTCLGKDGGGGNAASVRGGAGPGGGGGWGANTGSEGTTGGRDSVTCSASPGSTISSMGAPVAGSKKKAKGRRPAELLRLGFLMAFTMTVHNLPEGFAVAMAAYTNFGVVMAVAVAVHNIPEGIIVAAPVYAATNNRWQAFGMAIASGLSEPLGAVLALTVVRPFLTETRLQFILGFVGGIMFAVCFSELIPEGMRCRHNRDLVKGMLLGATVMGMTLYLGV